MDDLSEALFSPERVWSRSEVLSRPSPAPAEPGIYAWYFKNLPPTVTASDCVRFRGLTLLYVGISPARATTKGIPSRRNIRNRLREHLRRNASSSTLRLSLGCLLSEKLGIELRRVGGSKRLTFSTGEATLNGWLDDNAFVTWAVVTEPWKYEADIVSRVSLPLNLDHNDGHRFREKLSAVRHEARQQARRRRVLRK